MRNKRFSSFLRAVTKAIGITIVVPMFLYANASSAQSDNDQSRLLLEVQQMRQEIAELRDTVDRQAFQLKKIRSELDSAPQYGAVNNAVPSQPAPFPQGQLGQAQVSQPLPQSGAVLAPSVAQGTAQADTGAYGERVISADANDEVDLSGAAPVTQNSTDNGQRQYPPVIDRSVLTSGTYNGTSTAGATGATTSSQANPGLGGYVSANDYNSTIQTQTGQTQTGQAQTAPTQPANQYPQSTQQVADEFPQGQRYPQVPPVGVGADSPSPVTNAPVATTGTGVIAVPQAPQGLPNTQVASPAVPAVVAPVQPAILPEQDYYQQGFELLKQSKHDQAVSVFKQQINAHPQGDFADDAYYWIAESMYVNRKLDIAKTNFKTILDNYTQSPRVPDAMLKIAYIEQDQGNQIEARLLLQDIMQYHPSSNAAISAKNRLAQLN